MTTALSRLLAKSKELREAATPGPWVRLGDSGFNKTSGYNSYLWYRDDFRSSGVPDEKILEVFGFDFNKNKILKQSDGRPDIIMSDDQREHNLSFIVHARNVDEAKDEMLAIMAEALNQLMFPIDATVSDLKYKTNRIVLDALCSVEEIARSLE